MDIYDDLRYFVLYSTFGLFGDELRWLSIPPRVLLQSSLYHIGRIGVFVTIASGLVPIIPLFLVGDFIINGTVSNAIFALTTPSAWPVIMGIRAYLPLFGVILFIPSIICKYLFDDESSEHIDPESFTAPEEPRSVSHIEEELGEVAGSLYVVTTATLALNYVSVACTVLTPVYAFLGPLSMWGYLVLSLKGLSVTVPGFLVSFTVFSLYLSRSGKGSFRENQIYFSPPEKHMTSSE